ncbi:hypothetical protein [Mesorhizobium sp. IMUNJ 23232]|uniref:hypothetical protein n=1 Tax=Mesorhizobium sp. IMUNJ 23232 TaxID=3376064 RepID=UPI0037BB55FE
MIDQRVVETILEVVADTMREQAAEQQRSIAALAARLNALEALAAAQPKPRLRVPAGKQEAAP